MSTCHPQNYHLLRERRLELGLGLRDLAATTGVSASHLSRFERGGGADEEHIKRLCSTLQLEFQPAKILPKAELDAKKEEWIAALERAWRHVPLSLYDEERKPAERAFGEMLKLLETDQGGKTQ